MVIFRGQRSGEIFWESWKIFRYWVVFFDLLAQAACCAPDKAMAIQTWQLLLGEDFFPTEVLA